MSDFDSENSSLATNSDTDSNATDSEQYMDIQENTDSEENDTEIIESQFTPYTDEPIAPEDYAETENDEEDPDGLSAQTLADREDGVIPLADWCKCKHCKTENLSGALEHRCCMEVLNIQVPTPIRSHTKRVSSSSSISVDY